MRYNNFTKNVHISPVYPRYLLHLGFSEKTCPINIVRPAKENSRSHSTRFIAKTKCFPIGFDANCSLSSFIVDISSEVHRGILDSEEHSLKSLNW